MPIRPENKALYPKNWKEIRARIQKRADDKCEECGVHNHAKIIREKDGIFTYAENIYIQSYIRNFNPKIIKVVCTVAHLDHTPENCEDDNLKFMCQRCHNIYDQPYRIANRKKNKLKAAADE